MKILKIVVVLIAGILIGYFSHVRYVPIYSDELIRIAQPGRGSIKICGHAIISDGSHALSESNPTLRMIFIGGSTEEEVNGCSVVQFMQANASSSSVFISNIWELPTSSEK